MLPCKGNDVANNEGCGCLEWTCLPNRRGEHDEQVEEDTESSEGGDRGGDSLAKVPHVSSECVSEEEEVILSSRWRLRSMRDPSTWRLSHCFPNMARNAARRALARELNRMDWTWTAEAFGPDGAGTSENWFGVPVVALSSIVRTAKFIWL